MVKIFMARMLNLLKKNKQKNKGPDRHPVYFKALLTLVMLNKVRCHTHF